MANSTTHQRLTLARIEALTLPPGKREFTLWDTEVRHLGVRVRSNRKLFVYVRKFRGRPLRLTLGDVDALSIGQAREEAQRISGLIAQGIDPREERRRQQEQDEVARQERERAAVTFFELWQAYVRANEGGWGERYRSDHDEVLKPPGLPRKRSKQKTVAGVLWPLRDVRLEDLTPERLQAHMKEEAARRPTSAAKAFRLLRAALRWGRLQPQFEGLFDAEKLVTAAGRHVAKTSRPKSDCLQREQLAAWFASVQQLREPAHRIYLQALLLTGARPGELIALKWDDVDFEWNALVIRDKAEGERIIPLTPYVRLLLQSMPRRGAYVFATASTPKGKPMTRPHHPHARALQQAGLPHVTLHGLRRSFGSLSEWLELPTGVVAQIMGHKPSAIAERHYRVRPLDLLRLHHTRLEKWILDQAGIEQPAEDARRLEVVS